MPISPWMESSNAPLIQRRRLPFVPWASVRSAHAGTRYWALIDDHQAMPATGEKVKALDSLIQVDLM